MSRKAAEEVLRRMQVRYPIRSLEDFLIGTPLNADAQLNDGWNAYFPVKGCELEATILFSDITSFSARTLDLTPVETLAFVNNFFSWITAEALACSPRWTRPFTPPALPAALGLQKRDAASQCLHAPYERDAA